jgi:hypothetical protein
MVKAPPAEAIPGKDDASLMIPSRLNWITSDSGVAFAALIASRSVQLVELQNPSFVSAKLFTVNVAAEAGLAGASSRLTNTTAIITTLVKLLDMCMLFMPFSFVQ